MSQERENALVHAMGQQVMELIAKPQFDFAAMALMDRETLETFCHHLQQRDNLRSHLNGMLLSDTNASPDQAGELIAPWWKLQQELSTGSNVEVSRILAAVQPEAKGN